MISKAKAERCVTHHWACDCREYRSDQMEAALKIILVWASLGDVSSITDQSVCLGHIRDKCREALGE
jgi:hypothetical protein